MTLTLPDVLPLDDAALEQRLQSCIDNKTKPLGALGRLEALMLRLGCILGSEAPVLQAPQLLVCAEPITGWRRAACRPFLAT